MFVFPRHRYQQLKNDKGEGNLTDGSQHNVTAQAFEVNVFFDGTGNNYANTTARILHGTNKGDSYTNYYSNVALMSANLNPKLPKVYIQGAGTVENERDILNVLGAAAARGETGIYQRVDEAFKKVSELTKAQDKKEGFGILKLNIFGFSRGSAYGRYFIHLAKTEAQKRLGLTPGQVIINFVGLFDTVSSINSGGDNVKAFNQELAYGKKVVHLVAKHEYRKNFRGTDITSAISRGVGYELEIPGAHSDVGGGYPENFSEAGRFLGEHTGSKSLLPFFLKEGFCFPADTGLKRGYSAICGDNALFGYRSIPHVYQFIPLNIMVKLTLKHTKLTFRDRVYGKVNTAPYPTVQSLLGSFVADALKKDGVGRKTLTPPNAESMKLITRQFLHISYQMDSVVNRFDEDYVSPQNPIRHYYKG